jgi:two-component system CheB/CheR fusion protein
MTLQTQGHAAWDAQDAQALFALFPAGLQQYAVVFVDTAGCISGWSEGAYALTGFSAQDVLGQSVEILFTPEDAALELHLHELNSARLLGSSEDERWHMRKDGSRLWASGITVPLGSPDALRGFAKLFRDATHLRLRLDALEEEVRQLRRMRKEQNLVLATIAHELRSPLQPLTTATELLSQRTEPELRERATRILRRQIQQMERLVEDLVDMARVQQGALRIAYAAVPLQPLLEEAMDAWRDAAARKQIALFSVLPPVPVEVEVDPGRITQVIGNLLGNAVKFTPAGGQVTLQANVEPQHFVVRIRDTGRGIGPELQPRIFEMFTQADGADTGRGQGLGIGLALVKQIVALHGGSVEVKSEGADKGSEFAVRVPLAKPATYLHGPLP